MGLISISGSGECSGEREENLGVPGLRKRTVENWMTGDPFIRSINIYEMPVVLCARFFYPESLSHSHGLALSNSFSCVALAGLGLTM